MVSIGSEPSAPPRPWQVKTAAWMQFLTAVVLLGVTVALLAAEGSVHTAASQLILEQTDNGKVGLADVDDIVNTRFVYPAIAYLLFALVYGVLGFLNDRGFRVAGVLSWTLCSALTFLTVCWWLSLRFMPRPAVAVDYVYELHVSYVEEAAPAWFSVVELLPLLVLLVGLPPIILLLVVGFKRRPTSER